MDDSSTDSIPLVKRPNIFKGLFKENKKILGHFEEETKDIFCPICYAIIDEIKAQIDCCTHEYCFSCLEQWLKVSSACPLCKKDITQLIKVKDSQNLETIKIEKKELVIESE